MAYRIFSNQAPSGFRLLQSQMGCPTNLPPKKILRSSVLAAGMFVLAGMAPLVGHTATTIMGSPLTAVPNITIDCSQYPVIADLNGNYQLVPSNTADCTWRQSGVFGVTSGDTRFSSVPADGWITSVSVRSGPNPAPLSFVIFRQLGASGFGENSQCCFFVSETGLVQPQPNAISTFQTFIPVQRNTLNGVRAFDLFGVSAPAGAGSLPVAQVGMINNFVMFNPGSVNAGYFYPRIGSLPNDSGGGRREEGIPGIELLVQFTFCPRTDGEAFCRAVSAGTGAGSNGNNGGNGGGNNNGGVTPAGGPALRSAAAPVADGRRAAIDLGCNGSAVCKGILQLLSAGTGTPGERLFNFGSRRFRLPASGAGTFPIKLSKKARNLLAANGGSLPVTLRIKSARGAVTTVGLTLTP